MKIKKVLIEFWKSVLRNRRHILRVAGFFVGAVVVLEVVAQIMYPVDQALLFQRVGGVDVGGKTRELIVSELDIYSQEGELTVVSPSGEWREKWQTIGIGVDSDSSADIAVDYQLWERFIPFSAIIKMTQSDETPLISVIDQDRLDAFAARIVEEDKRAAADATIVVQGGEVVVNEAVNGYKFTVDSVKSQVRAVVMTGSSTLRLVEEDIPYVRSAEKLEVVRTQAETVLSHQLTITAADNTYSVSRDQIGGWLKFTENADTRDVVMEYDREAIKAFLLGINSDVAINPGTITVTLMDGVEVSRTSAAQGRSVAVDSSIDEIISALAGVDVSVSVALQIYDVAPRVNYVRTYSQSNSGLMAIIQEWNAAHYGDFAVIVKEIGGQKRYAEYKPDKSYVTASTFKLFVYYGVSKKIDSGEIGYGTITDMGWSVEACLEEMIVRSTNACATSLMNLIGWQWNEDIVRAAGFTSTWINNYGGGDKYSTVRDESNYMTRLNAGTLMSQEPTSRLLGYLKRQIWRGGIPSGAPGVVVADKVGFYNGWIHDIAIVYAPSGTYILAIMSKGGSDPAFADLSRRVYNFFMQ